LTTKLEKHLEALGEETSGNAHDAVTFSGKGLGFLRDMFKGAKKRDEDDMDDDMDEDDLDDDDEDEDEDEDRTKKSRKARKNANGGDLEEEDDEDLEDPGQQGDDEIITNHGKRVKGEGAVKKNARQFDVRRFEKSFDEFNSDHEDVLDASDALSDLSNQVRKLGKSTHAGMNEIREQNLVLAKAVRELLKSNAALAADLEQVKKQPVSAPPSGFVVMSKNDDGKARRLSKSDIQDVVEDAMYDGLVDSGTLARLGACRSQQELKAYVDGLPADVQSRL
jgi:cobalamin biosynthesis protein CobT